MRVAVIGFILLAPAIWAGLLVGVGWLWPVAKEYLTRNTSFSLGSLLGLIAILLTPLSAKGRADFSEDFETSYGRFYTSAAQALRPGESAEEKEELTAEAHCVLEPMCENSRPSSDGSQRSLLASYHIFDSEVVSLLESLARKLVAAGICEVNPLVDELHNLVSSYFEEDLTKRDVRDAFSGYRGLDHSDPEVQRSLAEIQRLHNEADGLIKELEAAGHEENQSWQQAEVAYREALRLNSSSKDAQEGLNRVKTILKAAENAV